MFPPPDDDDEYGYALYRDARCDDEEEEVDAVEGPTAHFSADQEWFELFLTAGYHLVFRVDGAILDTSDIKCGGSRWTDREVRDMITDFLVTRGADLRAGGVSLADVCNRYGIPESVAKSIT